jgi:serine/threonine protein phosphatase 1
MNGRIIAIGDIHGCHAGIRRTSRSARTDKNDRLILLGDLVNRGPDSKA